ETHLATEVGYDNLFRQGSATAIPHPLKRSNVAYDYLVTVLDEKDAPLPGVCIYTDDYTVTATTDMEGIAVLKDVKYNQELNFTFIGYRSLKLPFYEIRKKNGKIKMYPEVKELNEVVVVGRRDDRPEEVPYTIGQVTREQLALTESQTTVDALQQHAGVFVQKSQMGGGSPIMRGFEASRVLLVVDGVRMNNAIYRSGHLQNAITIDNGMLERMEVTFGPGSLLYGSDAMGGVVHFRSKEPKLNFNPVPGSYHMENNFFTRFASANEEKSVHADVNFGRRAWASLTSFTYTDYGNLRAGNNRPAGLEHLGRRLFHVQRVDGSDQVVENVLLNADSTFSDNSNVQVGTAYSQLDFAQKIKYQPNSRIYHLLNFQFSTSSDVPRYDALTELTNPRDPRSLKWADWFYGPQKRLLTSLKSRYSNPTGWYDRATFIASYQHLEEDRLKRRIKRNQRKFSLENVDVFSLTADFDKKLDTSGRNQLIYGLDLNHNLVRSEAGNVLMSNEGLILNELSRYPGNGNRVTTSAVYASLRRTSSDSTLTAHAGLRYTTTTLFSKFSNDSIIIWPQQYLDGIGNTHSDLTWSGGITYSAPGKWQLRALLSKAFRSPNLDDFAKIREKNGFVTIPNPNLKPETSINAELSLSKQLGNMAQPRSRGALLSLTGYYTRIKDFIVRREAYLPNGSRMLVMGIDTLETIGNANAASGFIYGGSLNATAQFGTKWRIASGIHFTKGKEVYFDDTDPTAVIDTLVPASHIPPTYGNFSLTYTARKFTLRAALNYFGKKPVDDYGIVSLIRNSDGQLIAKRDGGSDNIELSYTTAGYYFKEINENGRRRLQLTCNNPNAEGECDPEYLGTLSYTTFNLYTSYQLTKNLTFNFAVENITDRHYRPFASGISGAGRNFIFSLRAKFGQ
ncbi:MAG TPA: hypothetical protein ENJ20_05135, partial [Bacteroidetes bacterium]|nr:hypothetical protein [Bacteroidota bacterium]